MIKKIICTLLCATSFVIATEAELLQMHKSISLGKVGEKVLKEQYKQEYIDDFERLTIQPMVRDARLNLDKSAPSAAQREHFERSLNMQVEALRKGAAIESNIYKEAKFKRITYAYIGSPELNYNEEVK